MDAKRRQILTTGTSAALGAVIANSGATAAGPAATPVTVPPLSGRTGLRFATFLTRLDEPSRLGLVQDNGQIIDLSGLAHHHKAGLSFDPTSMISLIASGDRGLAEVMDYLKSHGAKAKKFSVNAVRLLSPIPHPQANIYCVGWNYLAHFDEGKSTRADQKVQEYPKVPVLFSKGTQTMNGPFDPIPYNPGVSVDIDWEAELAVIIGRRGTNISEAEAMSYVFGYSAYNDTTARDVQQKRHSGQWFKGKSIDGHGPMGPWIVTAGGVNLDETRIICRVNGVEKQNASYQQMYFKIPTIIAELSRGLTLLPGDIIATGTPAGVGYSRKPPEFLKPGDMMETEITGVGILRNPIGTSA